MDKIKPYKEEIVELFEAGFCPSEAGIVLSLGDVVSITLNHVRQEAGTKVYYMTLKDDAKTPKQRRTEVRKGWLEVKKTIKNFKSSEKFIELHVSNQLTSPHAEFCITKKK